jgi:hypothetical protein
MIHGSPNFATVDESAVPSAAGDLHGEGDHAIAKKN